MSEFTRRTIRWWVVTETAVEFLGFALVGSAAAVLILRAVGGGA